MPARPTSEPAAREDLRSRRRRLVQDDLAWLAVRLFLERGYDAVSVDEIAAAAGMSQRSFFRYFGSKDEVLLRYHRSLRQRLVSHLRERPDDEAPLVALRAAYLTSSHVEPADRARVRELGRLLAATADILARSVGETVLDEELAVEFARRMDAPAGDRQPTVLASAVTAAATAGWNAWVLSDETGDPSDAVAAAIDLLGLAGLT